MPGTLVGDGHPGPGAVLAARHDDRRATRRKADCVRGEVAERGPHRGPVAGGQPELGRTGHLEVHAAGTCRAGVLGHDGTRLGSEVEHVGTGHRKPAVLGQIVHGASHAVGGATGGIDQPSGVGIDRRVRCRELEVGAGDGERGA